MSDESILRELRDLRDQCEQQACVYRQQDDLYRICCSP